jgi:hypothetical protein
MEANNEKACKRSTRVDNDTSPAQCDNPSLIVRETLVRALRAHPAGWEPLSTHVGSGVKLGPSASVWRSESGALLKVVRVDAGGAFSGVFLSSPTNPCPVVPYNMAGGVRGLRVGFQTSRNWTSDCSMNAVWSGRFVSPTTIAVRWVATGPGRGVRVRGSEVFHRL